MQDILNFPQQLRDAEGHTWSALLFGREEPDGQWTGWLVFVGSVEGPARISAGPVTRQPSLEALYGWGAELKLELVEAAFEGSRASGMELIYPPEPGWA